MMLVKYFMYCFFFIYKRRGYVINFKCGLLISATPVLFGDPVRPGNSRPAHGVAVDIPAAQHSVW